VRADVTSLPFPAASFDKVISSEVLEHLEDDASAMREVARVLRPGGACAVTVPNANYPLLWDPINYVREALGLGHFRSGPLSGIWTDHRRLYSTEHIVGLIERAGLRVTDLHQETRYVFPFSHNLVYVVGKALIESGFVGGSGKRSDLWTDDPRLTMTRALARVVTWPDRFNREAYANGRTVSICVRAEKTDDAR
jgi:SAM-dependent methyltransferase